MLLHILQSILGYSENVSPGPPALLFGEIQLHHPISSTLSQEKKFPSPKRWVSTSARKPLVQVLISEEPQVIVRR